MRQAFQLSATEIMQIVKSHFVRLNRLDNTVNKGLMTSSSDNSQFTITFFYDPPTELEKKHSEEKYKIGDWQKESPPTYADELDNSKV
jgi:hypothetical protein